MSKKNGLADPTRLKPFDSDDNQMLRVVIETPKGSRNKFAFDPDEHIFELESIASGHDVSLRLRIRSSNPGRRW